MSVLKTSVVCIIKHIRMCMHAHTNTHAHAHMLMHLPPPHTSVKGLVLVVIMYSKRHNSQEIFSELLIHFWRQRRWTYRREPRHRQGAVSYTHLTLPTTAEV